MRPFAPYNVALHRNLAKKFSTKLYDLLPRKAFKCQIVGKTKFVMLESRKDTRGNKSANYNKNYATSRKPTEWWAILPSARSIEFHENLFSRDTIYH